MKKIHIHLIRMGGTIEFKDPDYGSMNEQMMKLDTSIDTYLKNMIKPNFIYSVETVCEKDSRAITEKDLEKLNEAVQISPHDNILITHGTYTIAKTARYLDEHLEEKNFEKKIILTGSMVPIVGFAISDAAFNLGYSFASFPYLNPGVYICTNGGLFPARRKRTLKN